MMSNLKPKKITYKCRKCKKNYNSNFQLKCDSCGGVITPIDNLKEYKIYDSEFDIERYWDFMPLERPEERLPFGNLRSPLIHSIKIGQMFDLNNLFLKDETKNNTKSTKDRMAVASLNFMKEKKVQDFVVTSTGNSTSAFGYLLGEIETEKMYPFRMHCIIPKLFKQRHRNLNSENILTYEVENDFFNASKKAKDIANENGFIYEGGFFNCARRAGLSMAFLEAWEQLKYDFSFYFQAVSSGMGMFGVYEATLKLYKLGYIRKLPKLICVQQESCSPMVNAFKDGSCVILDKHKVNNPHGLAKAILRGDPSDSYPYLYEAIKHTNGSFVSVSDGEIEEALLLLRNIENIKATYDGAVALAGAIKYFNGYNLEDKQEPALINITG